MMKHLALAISNGFAAVSIDRNGDEEENRREMEFYFQFIHKNMYQFHFQNNNVDTDLINRRWIRVNQIHVAIIGF